MGGRVNQSREGTAIDCSAVPDLGDPCESDAGRPILTSKSAGSF